MERIITNFALYEMKTLYTAKSPEINLGYIIVYNPQFDEDGTLRCGFLRLDISTLYKDYSRNRYGSIFELETEIMGCLGRPVVEAFACRYLSGWYHTDVERDWMRLGCIEFCNYLYDLPYTIAFVQQIRPDSREFSFRAFGTNGVFCEDALVIKPVSQVYMARYVKEDDTHIVSLRRYDIGNTEIQPGDLYTYQLNDEQILLCSDTQRVLSRLIATRDEEGNHALLLTYDEAVEVVDFCDFNLSLTPRGYDGKPDMTLKAG